MRRPSSSPGSDRAVRGALKIVAGSLGGQLLLAASAPVIARVYTPSEFGVFMVAFALVTTLGTVGPLRFDTAIPVPRRDEDAIGLLRLGLVCTAATTAVTTVVAILFADRLSSLLGVGSISTWLWTVPLVASMTSTLLICNQYTIRLQSYGAVASRTFLVAAVTVAGQIAGGLWGLGVGGLLGGYLLGQLAGIALLATRSRRRRTARLPSPGLRAIAAHYRRFPLVLTPAALLNVLSLQAPVITMSVLFGTHEAGWLGLTQRVLGVPISVIGVAVGQVYLGELARLSRERDLSSPQLFRRATVLLSAAALPTAAVLLLAGPPLFEVVFGSQWATSGEFSRALALSLGFQLVASPLASTLLVLERQVTVLVLDAVRLSLTVGGMVAIGAAGGSPTAVVWGLGATGALTYALYWLSARNAIHVEDAAASSVKEGSRRARR